MESMSVAMIWYRVMVNVIYIYSSEDIKCKLTPTILLRIPKCRPFHPSLGYLVHTGYTVYQLLPFSITKSTYYYCLL